MINAENASFYIPLFLVVLTAALYACYLIVKVSPGPHYQQ